MTTVAHTEPRRAWVEHIMGTAMSVQVIGEGSHTELAEGAVAACFAELRRMDELFSPYRADSAVSRIRRGEAAIADCDPRVADVERACREWEQQTQGRFSAWWDGGFDPTGYVKGWAVENASTRHLQPLLDQTGVTAVGINAGGDLRLFTAEESEWTWQVGIADPRRSGELAATLEVRNGAVATSGTAERGRHIYDPRTSRAAHEALSATVVADDLVRADVWATAAMVAGSSDLTWLSSAHTRGGIVISADGDTRRWVDCVEVRVSALAGGPWS